ncbi:YtxH domain-containing protein [Jeotgalibacillus proteolyticus]|uniref:YtxH domain-containing protein n=1 Tax=Jeotgalibacillus proteolyticus TaxID=2082395 RepID=A0A2S5GF63_9BACL|nr:YtxH domain-containing protein [Jeotgalibacillus proteolyticus]PPA71670.1 hypothetical protein C4B60_06340 [Jeotgalibacillus proteolyticus]
MTQQGKQSTYDTHSTTKEPAKESGSFILGAVIGGAIGAATALFLAPKSGTDLRRDLNTQAGLLKERSYEWKDQAVTKGNEIATTAKEKSAELSSLAKEKTSGITQTVQSSSNALVEKVKSFKDDSSDDTDRDSSSENFSSTSFEPSNTPPSPTPNLTVNPVDPLTPDTNESPLENQLKEDK